MHEPELKRWLGGDELLGASLTTALEDAQASVPTPALMSKMEATLLAGMHAPIPPVGPGGTIPSAPAANLGWGLAAAATLILGIGGYALLPTVSPESPLKQAALPELVPAQIVTPVPPSADPEPHEEDEVAAIPEAGPPVTSPSQRHRAVDEASILERARRAVRARPIAALRRLQQHQRRYPNGTLSEEREAIRVEALISAGRSEEAVRAAERFLARYPGSVHRLRVRSLVAD